MEACFPISVLALIVSYAPYFSACNFLYFQGFMSACMLSGQSRKTVADIAKVCFFVNRHLSGFERFLSQYKWDLEALQKHTPGLIQAKPGDRALVSGAHSAWVDTTLIAKVKGKTAGVQKWHDHSGNPDRGDRMVSHHQALVGLSSLGLAGSQIMTLSFPLLADLISGNQNLIGFVVDAAGLARRMGFWDCVSPLIA